MIIAELPRHLTNSECGQFLAEQIVLPVAHGVAGDFCLDFSKTTLVDPSGVASLYNALQFLSWAKREISFRNHDRATTVNLYLDDSGFFSTCLGEQIFQNRQRLADTTPFHIFDVDDYYGHLISSLMPWISQAVGIDTPRLEVLRTTLEEAFHNVRYHSGVKKACVFAEHFPHRQELEVIFCDHGIGVPQNVRTKFPLMSDTAAVELSFKKGFTTGSVVVNRGWGLWQLSNYAAQKTGGTVSLRSGYGVASATQGFDKVVVTAMQSRWAYPGTLVRIVLKTDTLKRLVDETEKEVFSW